MHQFTEDGVINFYRCENDKTEWVDLWDCGCDDRCPTCNAAHSPYLSLAAEDVVAMDKELHQPS